MPSYTQQVVQPQQNPLDRVLSLENRMTALEAVFAQVEKRLTEGFARLEATDKQRSQKQQTLENTMVASVKALREELCEEKKRKKRKRR